MTLPNKPPPPTSFFLPDSNGFIGRSCGSLHVGTVPQAPPILPPAPWARLWFQTPALNSKLSFSPTDRDHLSVTHLYLMHLALSPAFHCRLLSCFPTFYIFLLHDLLLAQPPPHNTSPGGHTCCDFEKVTPLTRSVPICIFYGLQSIYLYVESTGICSQPTSAKRVHVHTSH